MRFSHNCNPPKSELVMTVKLYTKHLVLACAKFGIGDHNSAVAMCGGLLSLGIFLKILH